MKIYTRTGDRGETSLIGGGRIRKDDLRIDAYGTVDELCAVIGVARAASSGSPLDEPLRDVQFDLFELGAFLAAFPPSPSFPPVSTARIEELEASIDRMDEELPPLTNFILPGGSSFAAHLHLARTVCRRAERFVVGLEESDEMLQAVTYLNRLSDYLFVAARYANHAEGIEDVAWKR